MNSNYVAPGPGTACPVNCTFPYWSVVPPTHCPRCGRCLGCGAPTPITPWRPAPYPYPYYQPTWVVDMRPHTVSVTYTSDTT